MLKKQLVFLMIFAALCLLFSQPVNADVDVSAASAVLIEPVTGKILFEKNKDERRSMASTTKIMTALLTLESGRLDEVVTVPDAISYVEGTAMGLKAGDKITLEALVYGMMLPSGNDAANTAALALGGSIEEFAVMMNERAKQIGMKNTNFVTPSGLDDENHYSTAYDMALLAAEAMKNPKFKEIASSKTATVEFGNPPGRHSFSNHNRLLREYEGATGIKTGFTKKSGRCLVSSAERDGVTLIAVTLRAPNDWRDHKNMLDYGFSRLSMISLQPNKIPSAIPVSGGKQESVPIGAETVKLPVVKGEEKKITCKTYLSRFVYAPVKKGEVVGSHVFYYDGREILSVPITAIRAAQALEPVETTFLEKAMRNFLLLYRLTFS